MSRPLQNDDGRCDDCGVKLLVDDCYVHLCVSCTHARDEGDEAMEAERGEREAERADRS